MNDSLLRDALLEAARSRGFVSAGVASVEPFTTIRDRALEALAAGRFDGMPWLDEERIASASDPVMRWKWGRSLVALAWPYAPAPAAPPAEPGCPRGRIGAYACMGDPPADYHDVLRRACDDLVDWLRQHRPGVRSHRFIDHGWLFDRAVAERAGIGFSGKNTCLLTPEAGSYVLLAALLLDVELPPGRASVRSCGSCTACIPACPTGAITAPGVIDATRCISYLTIEHSGAVAEELRPMLGTWVFGCDLCQEACPINARRAPHPAVAQTADRWHGPVAHPDLIDLLQLDEEAFDRRFGGTALARTGRTAMARNAAYALGNSADHAARSALAMARDTDPDEVVREAAAWALARLECTPESRAVETTAP